MSEFILPFVYYSNGTCKIHSKNCYVLQLQSQLQTIHRVSKKKAVQYHLQN